MSFIIKKKVTDYENYLETIDDLLMTFYNKNLNNVIFKDKDMTNLCYNNLIFL